MMRWLGSVALVTGTLLWASAAAASATYPDEVKAHLGLASAPACALCHENGMTGLGTVNTPFGKSARARGLVSQNLGQLDTTLDKLKSDAVDSDGDKVTDIAELVAGTDPNVAGGVGAIKQPDLVYGCTASLAPGHPGRSGAGLGVLALAAAVAWARRRRRAGALAIAGGALGAALLLGGCYDTSYVATEVCPTALQWTGGDLGSPIMHPGRACIDCHTRDDGPRFTFAGTVFPATETDGCFGSSGASIIVTGADGKSLEMKTNESGNFYSELTLKMPYQAEVKVGTKKKVMSTMQSTGDCNSCHTEKGKNLAPGRITLP